ncbi:MAG: phage regulatory CII family protein [Marinobacterium sp.]|nr:phage regulatory CII family protein [Marinobacterium sp.]
MKQQPCHGGIHTPITACYHAVHDYPHGGIATVAAAMQKSTDTLRKKVKEQNKTHLLTLSEAMQILRITGDTRILDAVCAQVNVVWFCPGSVPCTPGDMDVLKSSTGLMDKAMSVINELQTALDNDGEVDATERARIDKRILELYQASSHLSETARQFEPPQGKE